MPLTWQHGTLLMEWCLDCHKRPQDHLRPREAVFSMTWRPADEVDEAGRPYDQARLGAKLAKDYGVRDPQYLIACSICHR
jgi:hypothetical protein